jgi:hypothetical protein
MTRRLSLLAALAFAAGCRPLVASTARRAGSCAAADTYAVNLVAYMTELATATDDSDALAARRLYHLPAVGAKAVSLVTDDQTCRRVLTSVRGGRTTATGRLAQVYIVRVGDVFVVADRQRSAGASKAQLVLDRNLVRVATVAR